MMNCKSAKLTTKIPTILFYEIIKKKTPPTSTSKERNNTITLY
jgi:hypothetical protein